MQPKRKPNPPFATNERKGLKIKPFRFLADNNTTAVPQPYSHFRPPRLVKTKTRMYVEYWYRVPKELYYLYQKDWHRFRVFEDINRIKDPAYPATLLKGVKEKLLMGYNPFTEQKEEVKVEQPEAPIKWSLNAGLDKFLEHCEYKKLRPKTIGTYRTLVNTIKEYYLSRNTPLPENKLYQPVELISGDDIKAFFKEKRKTWENTTVNNNITYINIFFNWFVKEKVITENPAANMEMLPTHITKHRYYSDDLVDKLKKKIKPVDPELLEFIEFIYYTATRPVKEARLLRNSHILFDRALLFVPAKISKNKTDDYIPLSDDAFALLESRKNKEPDHYIFGGKKPRGENYFANHFKPFKEKFNLGKDYTIYGFKHTRAIHLAQAKVDPYQIMRLFRHQSLDITMAYLRDLGVHDFSDVLSNTRKF